MKKDKRKSFLKSKKVIKAIGALSLSVAMLFSGCTVKDNLKDKKIDEKQAVILVDNDTSSLMASHFNVKGSLAKEGNNLVRFEAIKGEPINVIVDEKSVWCMTEENKEAIKLAIDKFNEAFSYINPEYEFRYISKKDFEELDESVRENPLIFVTSQLRVEHKKGAARAASSPMEGVESVYGNGSVDSYGTLVLSSTAMVQLDVSEQTVIFMHEMAHLLGIKEHSSDEKSIMYPEGRGLNIKSTNFSKDVLQSLMALYYNPETNPHSSKEVLEYINFESEDRNKFLEALQDRQIWEMTQKDREREEQRLKEEQERKEKEEQRLKEKQENFEQKYKENLKQFLKSNGEVVLSPSNLVGKTFSVTNLYGQTRSITFNKDKTYLLTISNDEQTVQLGGNYEVGDAGLICKGQYFDVENFKVVPIDDVIYVSSLSDDRCVYGTQSNNCTLDSVLEMKDSEQKNEK